MSLEPFHIILSKFDGCEKTIQSLHLTCCCEMTIQSLHSTCSCDKTIKSLHLTFCCDRTIKSLHFTVYCDKTNKSHHLIFCCKKTIKSLHLAFCIYTINRLSSRDRVHVTDKIYLRGCEACCRDYFRHENDGFVHEYILHFSCLT